MEGPEYVEAQVYAGLVVQYLAAGMIPGEAFALARKAAEEARKYYAAHMGGPVLDQDRARKG